MFLIPVGDDSTDARHVPYVTFALIALNVVVYGLTLHRASLERYVEILLRYGFTPSDPSPLTFLTSMFLHADIWHVIGNMLFLWVFGQNAEARLGHLGFSAAYLATGVFASVAMLVFEPSLSMPAIGASGAISGILGLYVVAFPQNRIRLMLWIFVRAILFDAPVWLVLGAWIAYGDLWPILTGDELYGGVAHVAHVGGFAGGAAIAFWLRRREAAGVPASANAAARPAPNTWEKWIPKK